MSSADGQQTGRARSIKGRVRAVHCSPRGALLDYWHFFINSIAATGSMVLDPSTMWTLTFSDRRRYYFAM
jgi:hypothetical protein